MRTCAVEFLKTAALMALAVNAFGGEKFRVLVDAAPYPSPESALVTRVLQSYAPETYFSQRDSIEVGSILAPQLDGSAAPRGGMISQRLQASDLQQLSPRSDEVIVMGFDRDGHWVYLDYITDPWLVRAEFLSPELDGGKAQQQTRFYRDTASFLLTLPAGLGLESVDLLRPQISDGSVLLSPVLRLQAAERPE